MPNVRIDDNGVPKSPVFEQATPIAHRTAVTTVDAGDPNTEDAVNAEGYEHVDFDLDVTLGGTDPLLEVTPRSSRRRGATACGCQPGAPASSWPSPPSRATRRRWTWTRGRPSPDPLQPSTTERRIPWT